jgi:hypothetical protein
MKLRVYLFCVFCVFGTGCFAADQPLWAELDTLFGQHFDSPPVEDFVRKFGLLDAAKGDSGSYSPRDRSFALMFRGYRIECIVLTVGPRPLNPDWASYSSALPFGLVASDDRDHVIQKLGDPGHPKSNQWVFHGYLLMLSFDSKTGALEEVYIWKNEHKKPNQALQHNDPSCHVSCLRTPRASRGRG